MHCPSLSPTPCMVGAGMKSNDVDHVAYHILKLCISNVDSRLSPHVIKYIYVCVMMWDINMLSSHFIELSGCFLLPFHSYLLMSYTMGHCKVVICYPN